MNGQNGVVAKVYCPDRKNLVGAPCWISGLSHVCVEAVMNHGRWLYRSCFRMIGMRLAMSVAELRSSKSTPGRAEGLGIDVAARDGATQVAHVPLHGFDEGSRGVLEQMPSIADLQRL